MSTTASIVIVGAGQAGFTAATSLRDAGHVGPITVVGDEVHLPYQRPPLSKAFLKPGSPPFELAFRPEEFFAHHQIDLRLGERVSGIDRHRKAVEIAGGGSIRYDHLILATGTRERELFDRASLPTGVVTLRTADDAEQLRDRLIESERTVIVGGGFIGLEVASAVYQRGHSAIVLEAAPRIMSRVVSPVTSDYFQQIHRSAGGIIMTETLVGRVTTDGDRLSGVITSEGHSIAADLVLICIGVVPNDELAHEAGLAVGNGVIVNDRLTTTDPAISAIGDCARFPGPHGVLMRLESVQNAADQARALAQSLVGTPTTYDDLPWFWTEQAGSKLQIAGVADSYDDVVVRGTVESGSYSAFVLRSGELMACESVNRPRDHVAARRLLASGLHMATSDLIDETFDLKSASRTPAA